MDWDQSTMYEQRVRFILEVQQRTFSFAESCRRYSISRAAGYKWWTRFLAEGFEGLHDRSHRPHHCPHAVAEGVVEHVVDLRQRYGWGSRKIRKLTAEKFGEAPARRTIDRIFERHDLITKKRRRSGKPGHPGKPLTPMDEPNAVWTVDFKGQFKMLNGRYCYPLTIQDGFSRFLLECRGLYSTSIELAKPVFIKVFLRAQQRHFNHFCRTFNSIRPHEALDDVTRHFPPPALGRAWLPEHPARSPLRRPELLTYTHHTTSSALGAQKFPLAASSRISLSSVKSATARFRRPFSRSSSFRRRAPGSPSSRRTPASTGSTSAR